MPVMGHLGASPVTVPKPVLSAMILTSFASHISEFEGMAFLVFPMCTYRVIDPQFMYGNKWTSMHELKAPYVPLVCPLFAQ